MNIHKPNHSFRLWRLAFSSLPPSYVSFLRLIFVVSAVHPPVDSLSSYSLPFPLPSPLIITPSLFNLFHFFPYPTFFLFPCSPFFSSPLSLPPPLLFTDVPSNIIYYFYLTCTLVIQNQNKNQKLQPPPALKCTVLFMLQLFIV